jgi:hypothetical protein
MRHLQAYKIFEANKPIGLNTKQMAFLKKYVANISPGRWGWDVSYSTDPPIVNVFTSVNIPQWSSMEDQKKIKSMQGIHFGKIKGNFKLNSIIISSYEGFPKEVGGDFEIGSGSTLNVPFKDFPNVKIGGNFVTYLNNLESLEGCPEEVGSLAVHYSKILDLKGCPKIYTSPTTSQYSKKINLRGNSRLVSLEGIDRSFDADEIKINAFNLQNSELPEEVLIQGFKDFQKTGIWLPYYLMIKQKYEWCMHDDGMRAYLESKINPESVQEFINHNPIEAAVGLKGIWTKLKADPKYSEVKFPDSHSEDADLLSDLTDVGID